MYMCHNRLRVYTHPKASASNHYTVESPTVYSHLYWLEFVDFVHELDHKVLDHCSIRDLAHHSVHACRTTLGQRWVCLEEEREICTLNNFLLYSSPIVPVLRQLS